MNNNNNRVTTPVTISFYTVDGSKVCLELTGTSTFISAPITDLTREPPKENFSKMAVDPRNCACGLLGKRYVSRPDAPKHPNRAFWKCASDRCKFFAWEDTFPYEYRQSTEPEKQPDADDDEEIDIKNPLLGLATMTQKDHYKPHHYLGKKIVKRSRPDHNQDNDEDDWEDEIIEPKDYKSKAKAIVGGNHYPYMRDYK
jgi:hypothetical protein